MPKIQNKKKQNNENFEIKQIFVVSVQKVSKIVLNKFSLKFDKKNNKKSQLFAAKDFLGQKIFILQN